MNYLISIIVPVYKAEKYLDKCVQSIVDQTYTNLEIILVDDGSPDNCPEMCDEWTKKDNRIKVIHKENGGLSDARNVGLDITRGEYIAFVDSDDYISIYFIEKLHKRITTDKSDLAVIGIEYVNEIYEYIDKKVSYVNKKVDNISFWEYSLKQNGGGDVCGVAWNKLYKSYIFNDLRYDKGKLHEDVFILHKIIGKCNIISFIENKLYYYLQRENSITGKNLSFKNLDLAEGFLIRTLYFQGEKLLDFAIISISTAISDMVKINNAVEFKTAEKLLYKKLKKQVVKTSFLILKEKFNLKLFIRTVSFQISEPFYNWQTKVSKKK